MMMRRTLLMVLLVAGVISVKAQGEEETITDEELTTYAEVMVWAESEKEALSNLVSDSVTIWLEGSELTNAKYNELSKADKKDALESADATKAEYDEYAKIQAKIDEKAEKFKETYVSRIKDDIGAGVYNKIKSALKSDDGVKARYDEIYEELKESPGSEERGDTGDA